MKFDDARRFAYHSFRFLVVNGCGRCLLSVTKSFDLSVWSAADAVYHFVVTLVSFLLCCLSDHVIFSVLLNFQLIDD
jgi:hypothetical protein